MMDDQLRELAVVSVIVLTSASVLAIVARRASSGSSRAIWAGAFVALWLGTLGVAFQVSWRVPVDAMPAVARTILPKVPMPTAPAADGPQEVIEPTTTRSASSRSGIDLVLFGWIGITALLLVRWGRSVWRVRSIVRAGTPIELDVDVEVRASEQTSVPFLAGVARPVVVLPREWASWSRPQLHAVLTHELGHRARRDHWLQPLAEVAAAVHWFNPLVWWALSRLYRAREMAADDYAIAHGVLPSAYARMLVELASRTGLAAPAGAQAIVRHPSVRERVVRVLDARRSRCTSKALTAMSVLSLVSVAFVVACTKAAPAKAVVLPTESRILARAVDHRPSPTTAIVVGLYAGGRETIVATDPTLADARFGVGSISELFVELVFADMVTKGEVDPAEKVFGDVSYLDLATHASGLPALPDDFRVGAYTPEDLEAFVARAVPARNKFVYSYLGVGLQGHRLAQKFDTHYRDLVKQRVLDPLNLDQTDYLGRDGALIERLAPGHDRTGRLVAPRTDSPTLGACCGARSTVHDLLRFARVFVEPEREFERAVRYMGVPRTKTNRPGEMVGVGWTHGVDGFVFKRGGGRGFRSFIGVLAERGVAIVVLANHEGVSTQMLAGEILREVDLASTKASTAKRVALPSTLNSIRESFGGEIELVGWVVDRETVAPGDTIRVTFFYRALATITRDWKVFIHGDGETGAPRIHGDHYPPRSTKTWRPGEVVEDTFTINVPPDYGGDHFVVKTGWYAGRVRLGGRKVDGPTIHVE